MLFNKKLKIQYLIMNVVRCARGIGYVYGLSVVTSATMYIVLSPVKDVTLQKTVTNAVMWPFCAPYALMTQQPINRF